MRIILSTVLLILFGCKNELLSPPQPPDLDRLQLLATPETLRVETYQLVLSTFMWRDFMPYSPPDGKPLIALVYINAINVDTIKTILGADAIWLVYGENIWKSWFTTEPGAPSEQKPNRLVRIAREGPKWGPDVSVDVVIRITDSQGNTHLLRASKQYIGRTD